MTRAIVAVLLGLALLSPANAGTARFIGDDVVDQRRICYYEFDGLTYHYVIPRGYLANTRCAPSLETPFEYRPEGWAVLLLDEVEVHEYPERLCYYGAGGRLVVKVQPRYQACTWMAALPYSSPGAGMADLMRDESSPKGETRLCLYRLASSSQPTHYRMISAYSKCPRSIHVS